VGHLHEAGRQQILTRPSQHAAEGVVDAEEATVQRDLGQAGGCEGEDGAEALLAHPEVRLGEHALRHVEPWTKMPVTAPSASVIGW
jgi:hypothetical protein